MRDDMKRVVITRPRHGSSMKNEEVREHRRRVRDDNSSSLPQKASMKPKGKFSWHRKELSDFLNPLLRFLRKNCGRPWDKVYSEICQNLDRRGVINDHIFQHLEHMVNKNPIFIGKVPHVPIWGGDLDPIYRNGHTFYIDQNNLLQEPKKRRPKHKKKKPLNIKKIDEKTYLIRRKSDKVWFEIKYSKPRNYSYISVRGDTITYQTEPGEVSTTGIELPRVPNHYPSSIRTLSKKEKKRFSLT